MRLIQRRIILFGGLLLVIAILGVFFYKNDTVDRNPLRGGTSTPLQNDANTGLGRDASGGGIATGDHNLQPLSGSGMPVSQTGEAVALLEEWLTAISRGNSSSAADLAQAMIEFLHSNPEGNRAFYQRARQVLDDGSIDVTSKAALLWVLDRAATPAAIKMLAEWYKPDLPAELKSSVYRAIANIGQYYWKKESLPIAIPILEQLWMQSNDPNILSAVATALSNVGISESIDVLMTTLLNDGITASDIEKSSDPRVSAAWRSLQVLQNPNVISIFQQRLQESTNRLETSVYAGLLAGMGQTDATQALLSWARGAGDQQAPIAEYAFGKITSFECLQSINSALAQNTVFKSSLVKEAVLSTLEK
jgi:hypothetical protein